VPVTSDDHRRADVRKPVPATNRLRGLMPSELDVTQRVLYDSIVAHEVPWAEGAGARAIGADGQLLGPFDSLLRSPTISSAMLDVFRADKANTSLPASAHEVVILAVGAARHAAYELYAHTAIGTAADLPEATIDAIVADERPAFDSDEDAVAYDFARQLLRTDRVDDEAYARAIAAFGERGVVDMVLLIGLYETVCELVNVFEVPVPTNGSTARPAREREL